MRYQEGVFFDGNGFPVCLTAMPSRRCGCFSGIGRGAGVMDDFSLCDFGGHGAQVPGRVRRAACGVRSAGVRSCFRRDVVSGSRLPVPVPGCRGCGKCMEPFAGLSIRPAILSGACAAIPDRSGFSTLFRSAGSGGGVCPAFGDVRGYAGISVNGALPGMAHGGHAGGIKKSLMK